MNESLPDKDEEERLMIIKLSNGETVIGNVTKETQGYIELSFPFKLMSFLNQRGNMNLSIIKWDVTIDFDYPVRVFKSTIVACGKPNAQMLKSYREVVEGGFDTDMEEDEDSSLEQDLDTIEEKVSALLEQAKSNKLH